MLLKGGKIKIQNLKNKGKTTKGITLIALIITIIVLLILAGVVINMTLGQNGIVEKAQGAVNSYDKEAALEEMELKVSKIYLEYYADEQHRPTLQNIADKLYDAEDVEYIELGKEIASKEKITVTGYSSIIVKLNAYVYEFEITENGEVSIYDGKIGAPSKTEVILNKTGEQPAGTVITARYSIANFDGEIDLTGKSKWLLNSSSTVITDTTKYTGELSGNITDVRNINIGALTKNGTYYLHIMVVDTNSDENKAFVVSSESVTIPVTYVIQNATATYGSNIIDSLEVGKTYTISGVNYRGNHSSSIMLIHSYDEDSPGDLMNFPRVGDSVSTPFEFSFTPTEEYPRLRFRMGGSGAYFTYSIYY